MILTKEEIEERRDRLLAGKQKLLQPGKNNKKLAKSSTESYIMNLAPHRQNSQGKNMCPSASTGCAQGCLFKSGMGNFPVVEKTRRLNTEVFLAYQKEFISVLNKELSALNSKAKRKGEKLAVRLNGTSDIDFIELINRQFSQDTIVLYDHLIQYDYSKSYRKWEKYKDTQYYHTFSRSENNWMQCQWVLEQGGSVAVVFVGGIPAYYEGYPVFNGDLSDEVFNHPPGHIIGLNYKKSKGALPESNPFFVHVPAGTLLLETDSIDEQTDLVQ